MSKRRVPPRTRKDRDLKKQRRGFSEYDKALRHGKWRRKRRAAQSVERQKARIRLAQACGRAALRLPAEELDLDARRRRIDKWGPTPLADWIGIRLRKRVDRFAWNFFKDPYNPARHREAFAKTLESLVQGTDGKAMALAARFDRVLSRLPTDGKRSSSRARSFPFRHDWAAIWLRAFFADEPDWEPRFRSWVRRVLSDALGQRRVAESGPDP